MAHFKYFTAPAIVWLCGSLFLLCACDPPQKENPVDKAMRQQEAGKTRIEVKYQTSRLSSDDQERTIAVVNEEKISLGEFERRLNSQAPFARARYNTLERKRAFLDNMIKFEVLAGEARKRGFHEDPEVVLELKQAMVRKMLADELLARVDVDSIPEKELRQYYDEHKNDYVRPAKVRASQIVLPDEATAHRVIKELNAEYAADPTHKRRIFALKAREVSIDKVTAHLGGDMRFFARPEDGGTVDKKIADVAFGLEEVGKLSEPFQTSKGWHLLVLTARKQRYEKTFDDVKRSIANRLYRERKSIAELDFVKEAKAKARIDIHEELLNKIPDPPGPTPGGGQGDGADQNELPGEGMP